MLGLLMGRRAMPAAATDSLRDARVTDRLAADAAVTDARRAATDGIAGRSAVMARPPRAAGCAYNSLKLL
jgi:hypothetical protein